MASFDGGWPSAPASGHCLRQDGILYAQGQESVLAFDAATKRVIALANAWRIAF